MDFGDQELTDASIRFIWRTFEALEYLGGHLLTPVGTFDSELTDHGAMLSSTFGPRMWPYRDEIALDELVE